MENKVKKEKKELKGKKTLKEKKAIKGKKKPKEKKALKEKKEPKDIVNKRETNKELEDEVEYYEFNGDQVVLSDYRELIKTYNPKNNKTSPLMTIYEATLIIGKRATQIAYGAEPVIEYSITQSPEKIAIEELLTKKIPFIIKRQINNIIEYWKIEDMEINEEEVTIF